MSGLEQAATWLLGRPLTEADGVPPAAIEAAEACMGARAPAALKALYLAVGEETTLMSAFQQFLPVAGWEVFDGKLLFLEENQGVCVWAADSSGRVFQTEDPAASEWFEEPCGLDDFLHAVLYYQMAEGGYPFAGNLPAANFADVEAVESFIAKRGGERVVDLVGLRVHRVGEQALVWYLHDGACVDDGGVFLSTLTEQTYLRVAQVWGFEDLD
ncbi:MAG: hypothetical protein JNM76_17450 [Betaproteobacteria bacterium]|nr:hypothetical protein [Betaproteobacteria bacterium]